MCTCGIDIATQHATPASASSACKPFGDRPSGLSDGSWAGIGEGSDGRTQYGRPPAQHHGQRQHGGEAEQPDPGMGLPPSDGVDEVLDHRRPGRAREVVAAGAERDGDAAPAAEPERGVGQQRPEHRRRAEHADQHAIGDGEEPQALHPRGGEIAEPEGDAADDRRHHHAEAVGEPAHQHAARHQAEGDQGVGQRGAGAVDAELGLHRRQHDDHGPHPDAADRAEADRGGQARPSVGRLDFARRRPRRHCRDGSC